MAQITEKELTALGDLLSLESMIAAKCCDMAANTQDMALKDRYQQMAQQHRNHYERLYANLK